MLLVDRSRDSQPVRESWHGELRMVSPIFPPRVLGSAIGDRIGSDSGPVNVAGGSARDARPCQRTGMLAWVPNMSRFQRRKLVEAAGIEGVARCIPA